MTHVSTDTTIKAVLIHCTVMQYTKFYYCYIQYTRLGIWYTLGFELSRS